MTFPIFKVVRRVNRSVRLADDQSGFPLCLIYFCLGYKIFEQCLISTDYETETLGGQIQIDRADESST